MCYVELCIYVDPTSAFPWTFVYFWEVTVFMHKFIAWKVEGECICMHKSVKLRNRDDCSMDWSIPCSISATSRFSTLKSFCREQMVEIESTYQDLMMQKNPITKVTRKLTDPQRSRRSASRRRSTVGVKVEKIWQLGKLRGKNCRKEVLGQQIWEVGIPHPATWFYVMWFPSMFSIYC